VWLHYYPDVEESPRGEKASIEVLSDAEYSVGTNGDVARQVPSEIIYRLYEDAQGDISGASSPNGGLPGSAEVETRPLTEGEARDLIDKLATIQPFRR